MWMVREAEADRLSNEEFKKEPNRAAWVGPKLQFNEICRSLQVAQCLDFVVKNKSEEARPRPSRPIRHARRALSRNPRYGTLPATTPMLATVSPFFIEGTAQTYRTTPLDGARASHRVLPNRSVT